MDMNHQQSETSNKVEKKIVKKEIPAAAQRALDEAAQRQAKAAGAAEPNKREINGRGGLDPVRFGDWEKKGIAVDF